MNNGTADPEMKYLPLAVQRYSDTVSTALPGTQLHAAPPDAEDVVQDVFEKLLNYSGML
ncbi:MAG: hypothetical protein ACLT9S_02170 [Faecalibacterium sp.]